MVILHANSPTCPTFIPILPPLPHEWHVMVWHIQEELSHFQAFPQAWAPTEPTKHPQKFLESCVARFCLWKLCQQLEIEDPIFQQDERNRPFF